MQKKYSFNRGVVTFFLVMLSLTMYSQDLLKGKDLSLIKVDLLNSTDISKLKAQLATSGMTYDQAEQLAISKGLPVLEAAKLKQRLSSNSPENVAQGTPTLVAGTERTNNSSDVLDIYKETKDKPLINPLIFGSELYTSIAPNFEPNMKLATPVNYILGPDDQISVLIYGVQEYNGNLTVSAEGNVSIPNVGQIKLAGLSIEAATQKLQTIMGNGVYSHLKTGGSKMTVTLSKIRSIKVTIIGSNRPGNFNLSSLSTIFNALYIAGGPSAFGSFREIELVRQGQPIKKIDLYRFLLHGDQSDNIGLRDNDVIRIPVYKKRVELQGQVKRPGIFEILPGETFANILEFASGFTDTAYQASVKIFQLGQKERKILDIESASYTKYNPQSGDVFIASKILNRYQNRVRISGSVFRPDIYELKSGMKILDLIGKADGLKEDAYSGRGQIIRLQEDLTRSIIPFDVKQALSGDPANNIILQREDEVIISSILELNDAYKVSIQGEVRNPGQYEFVKNLTLKDLILQAGGFTDASYKNIEIARILIRDSITITDNRSSIIINAEINEKDLSMSTANAIIQLQPYDVITIRRKAGYMLPESVSISGEVQFPGLYALSSRNERVSDILKRSGGFTPNAYSEGAYIKRYKSEQQKEAASETVKRLQKTAKDSTGSTISEILREYDKIPLDLNSILSNPYSVQDINVRTKDEIVIPKFDSEVKISGEVLVTTQIPFQSRKSFKEYISDAGGFTINALRKRTYIVYANGLAAATKHFLFFKFYPKISPGCEIVIPKRAEKRSSSTGEILAVASGLASLAGVVIAILKL